MAVNQAELDDLFTALGIWGKISDGRLSDDYITGARRPSRDYGDGVSDIVRHHNSRGYHVATTHRITLAGGGIPHWDAKDIRIGDVVIYAMPKGTIT